MKEDTFQLLVFGIEWNIGRKVMMLELRKSANLNKKVINQKTFMKHSILFWKFISGKLQFPWLGLIPEVLEKATKCRNTIYRKTSLLSILNHP